MANSNRFLIYSLLLTYPFFFLLIRLSMPITMKIIMVITPIIIKEFIISSIIAFQS